MNIAETDHKMAVMARWSVFIGGHNTQFHIIRNTIKTFKYVTMNNSGSVHLKALVSHD